MKDGVTTSKLVNEVFAFYTYIENEAYDNSLSDM